MMWYFRFVRGSLKTIGRIFRVFFQQHAKSRPSEELERYLQNLTPSAMIKLDPDGLSLEDIKILKQMIKTAKIERPK